MDRRQVLKGAAVLAGAAGAGMLPGLQAAAAPATGTTATAMNGLSTGLRRIQSGDLQEYSPAAWSGWTNTGTFPDYQYITAYSGPSLVSDGLGRLNAFVVVITSVSVGGYRDRLLVRKYRDGAWGSWQTYYGSIVRNGSIISMASAPSVVVVGGVIRVIVLGADGRCYHTSYDDSSGLSTGWQDTGSGLGSGLGSAPAATTVDSSRLDTFCLSSSGTMRHGWYSYSSNSWSWEDLGGSWSGYPGACTWGSGRMDVCCRGASDWRVRRRYYSGSSWSSSWEDLGGYASTGIGCSSWGSNHLDTFYRGSDSTCYHRGYDNGWSDWENMGGNVLGGTGLGQASWTSGRIDVCYTSSDSAPGLYHRSWS